MGLKFTLQAILTKADMIPDRKLAALLFRQREISPEMPERIRIQLLHRRPSALASDYSHFLVDSARRDTYGHRTLGRAATASDTRGLTYGLPQRLYG